VKQRLPVLAQAAHALERAQHLQGDEIGHAQSAPEPLSLAHSGERALHRAEEFGKDSLIGEAMHQAHESVENQWGLAV
jgi:hypothetical protein